SPQSEPDKWNHKADLKTREFFEPSTSEEAGHITLRHLLSQTSGLAGAKGEFYDLVQDSRMTLAQSCHDVTRRPLVSRPGEVFEYGGPGFQVVGAVVEAVTGKVWADVFQEKISGPLGMSRTYWTHLRPDLTHDLPSPEMLNPVLQGGAVSTAEDYMHFLSMLSQEGLYRGKRILSSSSVKVMLSDQTSAAHMTPSGANVLPDAHYSLGNWCETWDNQGHCNRSSSIGVFGTYPWIEQKTQNFGIIFVYIRDNAFRFWKYFEEIRDSINEL
ncbi:serine hydrolase, partial [Gluconobacter cerinus]|uniref:serine hydrolase domain-containing protein n=2 Tax=Gluconobacter TaxID=441 RepID=UPI001B8D850F